MPPDSKLETGTDLSGRLLAIIRKPGKRPTALYLSGLFLSQAVSRLQYLRTRTHYSIGAETVKKHGLETFVLVVALSNSTG